MGFSPNSQLFRLSKNKQKRKNLNEAPLKKWTETVPLSFHTVHIDHKIPINPPSNGNKHCLVVIGYFSRYVQVYPVHQHQQVKQYQHSRNFFLHSESHKNLGMIRDQLLCTKSSQVRLMNLKLRKLLERHILPGPTQKLRSKASTLAHVSESFFLKKPIVIEVS